MTQYKVIRWVSDVTDPTDVVVLTTIPSTGTLEYIDSSQTTNTVYYAVIGEDSSGNDLCISHSVYVDLDSATVTPQSSSIVIPTAI